jgi:hypothetical protein
MITIITQKKIEHSISALPEVSKSKTNLSIEKIDSEKLMKNLDLLIGDFKNHLEKSKSDDNLFYIDEFELSLTVDAEAGVHLIGNVTLGIQAGIKVKIKRQK